MRAILFASLSTVLLAAAPAVAAPQNAPQSADAAFKALYTREWAWRMKEFAEDPRANAPVMDHLPKADPKSEQARLVYWQQVMTDLDAIPRGQLSAKNQINYDVYKPQLQSLIDDQRFRDYQMPANSDSAFWTDLDYTARTPFRGLQDYRNWIAQMRDIPRFFAEETQEMRAGLKRGFTPPKVTLEGRDASLSEVAKAKPADTAFYIPFKKLPSTIPAAEQAKLRAEALDVIAQDVQPAYAKLLKFWDEDYVPHTRTTLAAYDLPDGKAYYQAKIREFTTLDLTPEQIHQIGLEQVAKLHAQMIAVMKETGFKGDFPAFLHYLRTDPKFTAKTPLELLKDAAWIAKEFDGKASQYFGRLPRQRFAIKPVPADMAPFYTSGRGGPGVFLLNTYDLPQRPLYNLTALTLHESAPGHAFQIPLAMEDKSLPDFRRYTYISAYGEGWAVYCEWLGVEMGMYQTPYDRFGMLGWQIWRAARLVVDTGIHAQGWSRQQAIDYLLKYTTLPTHEAETEVDRYISWPGQALSYYLGAMAIRQDREKAEQALGPKFNICAFHDEVLSLGSVPLPVLNAHIDAFIKSGGVGPYPDEE
ncbi:MAG: DUF885 family protein [Alphaproteobacteria bacterium]|nr:DUF885 family protein [Alphaproteobacteria bacterium]MDE2352427.1 DUF885 family protein [Alphaproteobacteria bacterium]